MQNIRGSEPPEGNKWIMFRDSSNNPSGPSKKGGFNAKLRACQPIKMALTLQNSTLPWWAPKPKKCVAVSQHGPLSLYSKLQDPSMAKLNPCFPWYGLQVIYKGPLHFHGHGSWSMCKGALSCIKFSMCYHISDFQGLVVTVLTSKSKTSRHGWIVYITLWGFFMQILWSYQLQ